MENVRIFRMKNKNLVVKDSEIIENALYQESEGIKPCYSRRDYKTGEPITPPGWLVISSWEDGCAVVYRRSDGKMVVTTGWQADFCYI